MDAFRLTAAVRDETQIHTHMCYAEFNDIIEAIARLDADVITIETSRFSMEPLEALTISNTPMKSALACGIFTRRACPRSRRWCGS